MVPVFGRRYSRRCQGKRLTRDYVPGDTEKSPTVQGRVELLR